MNSKILLLSVAVISVGLFAMPSTLSLFAGQHTFDSGSQVSCAKCHQDIYNELSGAVARYGTSTAHKGTTLLEACGGCHKTGNISQVPLGKYANGTKYYAWYNRTNLSGAHAAVTMECVGCHSGVVAELTNSSEAHMPYYYNATDANSTIMTGANEACVGCHTHTTVKATWRRSTGFNMTVNESITGIYTITFTANTSVNTTTTFGGNVTTS